VTAAELALLASTFVASFVECVEALTIVLAMGLTRGWRAALTGTALALVALVAFTAAAGYALATWLPTAALQLVIGTLLLIFGLQWLRKAILRSSGRKALHDEGEEYAEQAAAGRAAEDRTLLGVDAFGLIVSAKGVFLEGVEVVFIVITFGANADSVPLAAAGAAAAGTVVVGAGALLRHPLARVPENTSNYTVGVLLTTFGTFWFVEGLGGEWPGDDLALLGLLGITWLASRGAVAILRRDPAPAATG
jgi:Ca2+/H+ antiporter, TMEM165/GDT1 family